MRDLFFNTPVRLKFLRSRQSETGMVSKLVASYVLAWPEIRWRLESSGRMLLRCKGDGDLRAALSVPQVRQRLAREIVVQHRDLAPGALLRHGLVGLAHALHDGVRLVLGVGSDDDLQL